MQRKPSENGTGRLNFLNWGQVRPIFRGELAVREYPPKYSVFVQVIFMFYRDKSQLNDHLVVIFLPTSQQSNLSIGLMGMVYLPTFTDMFHKKSTINVGPSRSTYHENGQMIR